MPRAAEDPQHRVPWLSAAGTGAGAAVIGAVIAIVAVAICWLPAAGTRGNADSALRAGGLAFLAALHGGITVDGVDTAFVPLGMTVLVGVIAWRAGARLAGIVEDAVDEIAVRQLWWTAAAQVAAFAITCAIAARLATLGTSSASPLAAGLAGAVLFAVTGGVAFVRTSALADELPLPEWLPSAARVAGVAVGSYLAAAAVLVAGSLVVHHHQVEEISRQVGGGWQGTPVLLLGVLAAPNAIIAGASYLAGPGFVVGSGSTVGVTSTLHGTLPAFPVLGALPSGHGATPVGWLLVVLTPLTAGVAGAFVARRSEGRWRALGAGSGIAALAGAVLAWQGGGAIGSGRLHVVGASPWQLGLAFGVEIGTFAAATLGVLAAVAAIRARQPEPEPSSLRARLTAVKDSVVESVKAATTTDEEDDQLAG